MKEPKHRTRSRDAIERVATKLNLPVEDWMQDWPLEVVDPLDIEIYVRAYTIASDDDEKFVIMEAIIQATDMQQDEIAFMKYWEQIFPILIIDFDIHEYTIFYWSCFEAKDDTECWTISKKMREAWNVATSTR